MVDRTPPILLEAFATLLRGKGSLERLSMRTRNFLSGLALGLLDDRQLAQVTARLYDLRGRYELEALEAWEEEWFRSDLPPSPATLLVGGAGSGREAFRLAEQGYRVVAFDPAPAFVEAGRSAAAGVLSVDFHLGAYEDLLDAASPLAGFLAGVAPFDGVLLGWGSLTHVPGAGQRADVLRSLRQLAPTGPILASFWMLGGRGGLEAARTWQWGARLARFLGGRQDLAERAGDLVTGRSGYAHWFTQDEIEGLARSTGQRLLRRPAPDTATFPHATFLPAAPRDEALEPG